MRLTFENIIVYILKYVINIIFMVTFVLQFVERVCLLYVYMIVISNHNHSIRPTECCRTLLTTTSPTTWVGHWTSDMPRTSTIRPGEQVVPSGMAVLMSTNWCQYISYSIWHNMSLYHFQLTETCYLSSKQYMSSDKEGL